MEEPVRQSYLDVLKRNLSLADRFSFITRLVYIGEYDETHEQFVKKVRNNIRDLNEEHGEVVLTGLFLVYPKYFVHLVEASEETIYRHFQSILVLKNTEGRELFGHIILLPAFYNVFRCYFSEWFSVYIKDPPELSASIESTELKEIKTQVKSCLSRIYEMAEYLMDKGDGSREKVYTALKSISNTMPQILPKITSLEYLLSLDSPVFQDLRDYLQKFEKIPYFNFYKDRIWPPPKDITPQSDRQEDPENGEAANA